MSSDLHDEKQGRFLELKKEKDCISDKQLLSTKNNATENDSLLDNASNENKLSEGGNACRIIELDSYNNVSEKRGGKKKKKVILEWDEFFDEELSSLGLYAVFDGHGSNGVSTWVSKHFVEIFGRALLKVKKEFICGIFPPKKLFDAMNLKNNFHDEVREKIKLLKKRKKISTLLLKHQENEIASPTLSPSSGDTHNSSAFLQPERNVAEDQIGNNDETKISMADIDDGFFNIRNLMLCEALSRAFMHTDVLMQKDSSRTEIQQIVKQGQQEQKGQETYMQRVCKDGNDLRLVEINGQRYLQVVSKSEDVEKLEDELGKPESKCSGDCKEDDSELMNTNQITRLDSTNKAEITFFSDSKEDDIDIEKEDEQLSISTDMGTKVEEKNKAENVEECGKEEGMFGISLPKDNGLQNCSASGNTVEESKTFVKEDVQENVLDDENEEKKNSHDNDDDEYDFDFAREDDEASLPDPGSPEGCGSTAIVTLVVGGVKPCLITANAGDSRGVLCRNGKACPLSYDHKPTHPWEKARIRAAGGNVQNGRVDGNLNLSRALGDLHYKTESSLPQREQRISAYPDVRVTPISTEDSFFILACDGIWDCKTNQEAVDFVEDRLSDNTTKLDEVSEELCDKCLAKDPIQSEGHGCDNMTCVIVQFSNSVRKSDVDSKVAFYGGIEDPYLGKEFSSDLEDDD